MVVIRKYVRSISVYDLESSYDSELVCPLHGKQKKNPTMTIKQNKYTFWSENNDSLINANVLWNSEAHNFHWIQRFKIYLDAIFQIIVFFSPKSFWNHVFFLCPARFLQKEFRRRCDDARHFCHLKFLKNSVQENDINLWYVLFSESQKSYVEPQQSGFGGRLFE